MWIDKREWEDTEENRQRATKYLQQLAVDKVEVTRLNYNEETEQITMDVKLTPIKARTFLELPISFGEVE